MDNREEGKFNRFYKKLYNLTYLRLIVIKFDLQVGLGFWKSVFSNFSKVAANMDKNIHFRNKSCNCLN